MFGFKSEEIHELLITADELNARPSDQNVSSFLIEQACKKANRLGHENKKVKSIIYEKEFGDCYSIRFFCDQWL